MKGTVYTSLGLVLCPYHVCNVAHFLLVWYFCFEVGTYYCSPDPLVDNSQLICCKRSEAFIGHRANSPNKHEQILATL